MSRILHWIRIDAPPERVFDALTTEEGLRRWWTDDVEAEPVEGTTAVFGFNDRAVVFRMRIDELKRPRSVRWTCLGDVPEWEGTRLEFQLMPGDESGTEVSFTHADWKTTDRFYRQCNTDWGRLMYHLKEFVEGRSEEPMMK